jgi:hypothetical protein
MRFLGAVTVVLAYFAAVVGLHPHAVAFDGLAFLMAARAGTIDYGHALYLPLLNVGQALAGSSASSERVAQIVSALGGAAAFALLLRRFEHGGAPRVHAVVIAACFGFSTLVWQEAGSIEPTTWTLVALLVSAEAAEAYGRRSTALRLGAAMLAFAAAVGFHLVSLCALPWLVSRARRPGGVPPVRHLLLLLAGALLVLLLALLGGNLGVYLRFWSGFVPDFRNGLGAELAWHLQRAGRLFLEGAPVLLALSGLAAFALLRARVRGVEEGVLLAAPYLVAYLILGKPLVGLLMPVILAGALVIGSAVALEGSAQMEQGARVPPGAIVIVLSLSAALQFCLSLPQALVWHREPDANRARAELFARHLPEGARLFAGPLANHLHYYWPALDVVALPELWHATHARDRSADPIEVVRQAVQSSEKRCLLSSDGAGFLLGLGADLTRLGLGLEDALPIQEDPRLSLFPLGE